MSETGVRNGKVIAEGDLLPDVTFVAMSDDGPVLVSTDELCLGRNVALFGLPGAYTPVCHKEHLPGIIAMYETLCGAGVDTIACTSINDIYVLDHWSKELNAAGKVAMLADGNAEFVTKCGLLTDMSRHGLGYRSKRYALLAADKKVTMINIEVNEYDHDLSSAKTLHSDMPSLD